MSLGIVNDLITAMDERPRVSEIVWKATGKLDQLYGFATGGGTLDNDT